MVTKNDILAIRGGQTKKFDCSGIADCNSARVIACWVGKNICPADVERYTTTTNDTKTAIWITAIKKERRKGTINS